MNKPISQWTGWTVLGIVIGYAAASVLLATAWIWIPLGLVGLLIYGVYRTLKALVFWIRSR